PRVAETQPVVIGPGRHIVEAPDDWRITWPLRLDRDHLEIFGLPGVWVRCPKRLLEIEFDWQQKLAARDQAEAQPRVGLATASDVEHDGPVRAAKTPGKRVFIGAA